MKTAPIGQPGRYGPAGQICGITAFSLSSSLFPLTWVGAGRVSQPPVRPVVCVMTFMVKVNTLMGRPPGRIQDRPFQMRLSNEFLERLDEWRRKQPDLPSRAEAIRRLTTAMMQILDEDRGKKASKPKKRKAPEK